MAQRKQVEQERSKEICAQITAPIRDYITGALDPESHLTFEQHLTICPDCVAFLNTYRKTIHVTRSLRFEDIPSEMVKRAEKFLKEKIKKASR